MILQRIKNEIYTDNNDRRLINCHIINIKKFNLFVYFDRVIVFTFSNSKQIKFSKVCFLYY